MIELVTLMLRFRGPRIYFAALLRYASSFNSSSKLPVPQLKLSLCLFLVM